MAIGGLYSYEKFFKIKSEKDLTEKLKFAILKTMQQGEVMNKESAA
jgi:hypothetical protein